MAKRKQQPQIIGSTKPRNLMNGRFASWRASKNPVLKFAAKFVGLTICFYALSFVPGWDAMLTGWLNENARLSSFLLTQLGEPCHASGVTIWSVRYGVTVEPGCSAFEFAAFYSAAVFSFPAGWRQKLLGVFLGIAIIITLNLVRIISLYWLGVHFPAFFDTVHVGVWPSVLVVATLVVCIMWLQWVTRRDEPRLA